MKPANVFCVDTLRGDFVKLLDFGVAKDLTESRALTLPGNVVGTLSYMAPEQLLGERPGFASDLYSVGATLYYLLSGKRPFQYSSAEDIARAVVAEEPEPLLSLRPDVGELGQIVHRALAKSPQARFDSAKAMHDAITAITSVDKPARATPPPSSMPTRPVSQVHSLPLPSPDPTPPVLGPPLVPAAEPTRQTRLVMVWVGAAVLLVGAVLVGAIQYFRLAGEASSARAPTPSASTLAPSATSSALMLAHSATSSAPPLGSIALTTHGKPRASASSVSAPATVVTTTSDLPSNVWYSGSYATFSGFDGNEMVGRSAEWQLFYTTFPKHSPVVDNCYAPYVHVPPTHNFSVLRVEVLTDGSIGAVGPNVPGTGFPLVDNCIANFIRGTGANAFKPGALSHFSVTVTTQCPTQCN